MIRTSSCPASSAESRKRSSSASACSTLLPISFSSRGTGGREPSRSSAAEALRDLRLEGPLVAAGGDSLRFSTDHRRTEEEHLFLVFNESWSPTRQTLRLNLGPGSSHVWLWDPRSGARGRLVATPKGPLTFDLELDPAQSVILSVPSSEPEEIAEPAPQRSQSR